MAASLHFLRKAAPLPLRAYQEHLTRSAFSRVQVRHATIRRRGPQDQPEHPYKNILYDPIRARKILIKNGALFIFGLFFVSALIYNMVYSPRPPHHCPTTIRALLA